MPITKFAQRPDSGPVMIDEIRAELATVVGYVCEGEDNRYDVLTAAQAVIPTTLTLAQGTVYRQRIEVNRIGHKLFYVDGHYDRTNPIEFTFRGSGRGETVVRKWAFSTPNSYKQAADPDPIPDDGGAIGWDGKEIQGQEIIVPSTAMYYHRQFAAGFVTELYALQLGSLRGYVNSATWRNFAAGEALFFNADVSDGTNAPATVDLEIHYSPNITGLEIGGITGIVKNGWDVVDVEWEPTVDEDKPTQKAKYVRIRRVYQRVNFTTLLGP